MGDLTQCGEIERHGDFLGVVGQFRTSGDASSQGERGRKGKLGIKMGAG